MIEDQDAKSVIARRMRADRQTRKTDRVREVYFVQAQTLGLVKIGVTNNADKRLASLQTFSPDRLRLLGLMVCYRHGALEDWLHLRFRDHRAHGEWFRPHPSLMAFIAEHAVSPEIAAATRWRELRRRGGPGGGLPWAMPAEVGSLPVTVAAPPKPKPIARPQAPRKAKTPKVRAMELPTPSVSALRPVPPPGMRRSVGKSSAERLAAYKAARGISPAPGRG